MATWSNCRGGSQRSVACPRWDTTLTATTSLKKRARGPAARGSERFDFALLGVPTFTAGCRCAPAKTRAAVCLGRQCFWTYEKETTTASGTRAAAATPRTDGRLRRLGLVSSRRSSNQSGISTSRSGWRTARSGARGWTTACGRTTTGGGPTETNASLRSSGQTRTSSGVRRSPGSAVGRTRRARCRLSQPPD
jgi:hypothetical protein